MVGNPVHMQNQKAREREKVAGGVCLCGCACVRVCVKVAREVWFVLVCEREERERK